MNTAFDTGAAAVQPRVERPLFALLPALRDVIPWIELCKLPTPVRSIELPPRADGQRPTLSIKDDSQCGGTHGGNKMRILETVLPAALARSTRLVALGAISSNWVRATCEQGRARGASVHAVVFRHPSGAGGERVLAGLHEQADRVTVLRSALGVPWAWLFMHARALVRGESMSWLPAGGSSIAGAMAYANAALELAADVAAGRAPRPDLIYVPLGSGGTAAGLAAGLALAGIECEVVGVRVVDRIVASHARVMRLARAVIRVLIRDGGAPANLVARPVRIVHQHFGGAYGRVSPAGLAAMRVAREHGLTLDPTYTAKAFAAVLEESPFWNGRNALYWHTLGHGAFLTVDLEAGEFL